MWGSDAVEQGDSWGWGSGLLEDLQQSGSCHPPNLGLLPLDDELPVDVQQEEYTEDSMVTDLLLDSDTGDEDPSPEYTGSHKHTCESSSDVTEGHKQGGSIQLEQNQHIPMQTREKPFICKQCGSGFYNSHDLNQHKQTHNGEKPFTCQESGVGISRSSHLKIHMKKHTGEKPFTCQECGVGFSLKFILKQHMRSHTGEKPYTCQECGVGFSRKDNLNQHMLAHTGTSADMVNTHGPLNP
jgi:uncharacterized Zn-finger protein